MLTTIKCPHCGKEVEISDAIAHEIQEKAVKDAKHEAQKEVLAERERSAKLLKQLEDLTDQIRDLRRKDEERELEMKKRLAAEEGKIKDELAKKFLEDHELKDKEKETQLPNEIRLVQE